MDVVIKKVQKRLPKGSHKGRQSAHNAATHKYQKQKVRTISNKAKARAAHLANHPNDLAAAKNIRRAEARSFGEDDDPN